MEVMREVKDQRTMATAAQHLSLPVWLSHLRAKIISPAVACRWQGRRCADGTWRLGRSTQGFLEDVTAAATTIADATR